MKKITDIFHGGMEEVELGLDYDDPEATVVEQELPEYDVEWEAGNDD